ncbi:MAG: N-acetylmuramoyl-L-alanine amidase, partial [Calditrichaeota bacterium]
LTLLFTFSFFIERILTLFAWLMDKLEISSQVLAWEKPGELEETRALRERAQRESDLLAAPKDRDVLNKYEEIPFHPEVHDKKPPFRLGIQEGSPLDSLKVRKEFWCDIFGMFIGIVGCFYWKVSFLRLINVEAITGEVSPHFGEFILLGIIIGSGSKPIHFLMEYLLTRKITLTKQELEESPAAEAPSPVLTLVSSGQVQPVVARPLTLEELIGFRYGGGVEPDRLQGSHLRLQPIDLILYHHTCMHSNASFEDLVEVFDQRGWLTGYHCVVFHDGSIRPFCRWDRIGNHAYGYNQRSLGLAFQGNFECDPRVPCSNIQGCKGLLEPTIDQLDAGAKIVALWCALYKIPLDFRRSIRPHADVADKACPGSNFPTERFQSKIKEISVGWKNDAVFAAALKSFKEQPMVMA